MGQIKKISLLLFVLVFSQILYTVGPIRKVRNNQKYKEMLYHVNLQFLHAVANDKLQVIAKLLPIVENNSMLMARAMQIAIRSGLLHLVNIFFDNGISLRTITNSEPYLWTAIRHGHIAIVEELLRRNAPTQNSNKYYVNKTALMVAVEERNLDLVNMLIAYSPNDINVGMQNEQWTNKTALMIAAENGYANIVARLTDAGANRQLIALDINERAWNLLMFAAQSINVELVQELSREFTIIHGDVLCRAIQAHSHPEIIQILINQMQDANINLNNTFAYIKPGIISTMNAIEIAAREQRRNIVRMLSEAGATSETLTPIALATLANDEERVQQLLAVGEAFELDAEDIIENLGYIADINPMHIAARNGNNNIIDMLCHADADINANYTWPLMQATNPETIRHLIEINAEIPSTELPFITINTIEQAEAWMELGKKKNAKFAQELYNQILLDACYNDDPLLLEPLLQSGYNIIQHPLFEGTQTKFTTPFLKAASSGATNVVKFLISQGADIKQKDHNGNSALLLAGSLEVACLLHEEFNEPLTDVNDEGQTALMCALTKIKAFSHKNEEYIKIVQYFFDKNVAIDLTDSQGNTILHYLAKAPKAIDISKVMHCIKNNSLNIFAENNAGETVLSCALGNCNVPLLRLLIGMGCDLNSIDAHGALHYLLSSTQTLSEQEKFAKSTHAGQTVKIILDNTCTKEIFPYYFDYMISAVKNHNHELITQLHNLGVPLHQEDSEPLLCHALTNINKKTIKTINLLVKLGAPLNAKNANGKTPLMKCSSAKSTSYKKNVLYQKLATEIAIFLIECGADLNIPSTDGQTALCYALGSCNARLAAFLLESGARVDIVSRQGWTPLLIAIRDLDETQAKTLLSSKYGVIYNWPVENFDDEETEQEDHIRQRLDKRPYSQQEMLKIIPLLIARYAQINPYDFDTGKTALHTAIGQRNNEATRLIVAFADTEVNQGILRTIAT